jgi:hypothetical protein
MKRKALYSGQYPSVRGYAGYSRGVRCVTTLHTWLGYLEMSSSGKYLSIQGEKNMEATKIDRGRWVATLLVMAISTLSSCSSNSGSGANASFSMKTDNTIAKSASADTVVVDTAKVLVTRLKFNNAGGDSSDIAAGPFVVNLDLSGTVRTIASANIPQGTYNKVKFELHKPDVGESVPDADFYVGTADNQRFSVIILGLYNGVHFSYKSRSVINETITISPPLIVADSIGVANATLLVNPILFFKKNGSYLNPTDTTANNRSAIDKSIQDAFKSALRDDKKNGTGS